MSISFQIPQSARFLTTVVHFDAPYTILIPFTPARFHFSLATQNVSFLTPLQPNTVYMIEKMTVGGDIPSEDFYGAINTVPLLSIRKQAGVSEQPENVYSMPIPIAGYTDNRDVTAFVETVKGGDSLLASITGVLDMTPNLIGRTFVRLYISLTMYAIDERTYNALFRSRTTVGPVAERR